jgi:transposase
LVSRALAGDQKKARQERRTIVWVDEAGFYLLAGQVRTYAPRGQTPILWVPLTRDHLSVISGITAQGQVVMHIQPTAFSGAGVVRYLRHLLHQMPGKVLIIWDGGPIHHDKLVTAFLGGEGAARLHVEQLPGYAPDLNPHEGIWHYLKAVELPNVACHSQQELRHELRLAVARLRHKPDIIRAAIRQCGY